jgi:hypothetical protein
MDTANLMEELSHTSPSLEGGFSWDGNETKNNEQQSGLRRTAVIRIKSEICKTLGITRITLGRYVKVGEREEMQRDADNYPIPCRFLHANYGTLEQFMRRITLL